jgi:ATP-dependent RNA helicase RhlE
MRDGINATAIHSDRTQAEREQALTDFKEGRSTVLVATDIAARGIDIEELPFVINYELPYTPEDYVHRIGRTGRAGMPGEAISLVCPDEMRLLADIEKLLKRAIPRQSVEEGAADREAEREYERSRESRPRREDREKEPRRSTAPATAAAIPAAKPRPQVAADGFDFSKPYEPASGTSSATTTSAPPQRSRVNRPQAALLGGFVSRDKK